MGFGETKARCELNALCRIFQDGSRLTWGHQPTKTAVETLTPAIFLPSARCAHICMASPGFASTDMHDGMRRFFFTGLAFLLSFLASGEGVAAGIDWRLRVLTPTQESGSLTDNGTKSTSPPTTSGLGFHIVMSNGFGFGTTRVRSKGTISANSVSSTSDNVDLSYTFGERWSVTLGVGWGLTGKATLIESGTRYDTENLRGGSGFALFGIPFLGGEALLGFRQTSISYLDLKCDSGSSTTTRVNPLKTDTQQVLLGFGFLF